MLDTDVRAILRNHVIGGYFADMNCTKMTSSNTVARLLCAHLLSIDG